MPARRSLSGRRSGCRRCRQLGRLVCRRHRRVRSMYLQRAIRWQRASTRFARTANSARRADFCPRLYSSQFDGTELYRTRAASDRIRACGTSATFRAHLDPENWCFSSRPCQSRSRRIWIGKLPRFRRSLHRGLGAVTSVSWNRFATREQCMLLKTLRRSSCRNG